MCNSLASHVYTVRSQSRLSIFYLNFQRNLAGNLIPIFYFYFLNHFFSCSPLCLLSIILFCLIYFISHISVVPLYKSSCKVLCTSVNPREILSPIKVQLGAYESPILVRRPQIIIAPVIAPIVLLTSLIEAQRPSSWVPVRNTPVFRALEFASHVCGSGIKMSFLFVSARTLTS